MRNYSENDLDRVVEYYRKPKRPTKINGTSQMMSYPNTELLSYFISDIKPSPEELAILIKHPDELKSFLGKYYNQIKEIREKNGWAGSNHASSKRDAARMPPNLPPVYHGINYSYPTQHVSAALRTRTERFVFGEEDSILHAKKQKETYTFPSGLKIPYTLLTDERSANTSIFFGGYCSPKNNEILIRENSDIMMNALLLANKNSKKFSKYKKFMDDYKTFNKAIVIAHEMAELELLRAGRKMNLSLELDSEKGARKILKQNGVPKEFYNVHHLLRSSYNKNEKNISQMIVDSVILK